MVLRADLTPRTLLRKAMRLIGPRHVFGIILNAVERFNRLYYYKPSLVERTAYCPGS
jgi:hypothetical protein